MTDIVERLRADAESTDDIGLCAEAADEIVHLGIQIDRQRQIIYELRSEIQGWKDRWIKENADHAEDVATAKHEIDALRQQLFEEHEAHLIAEQRWIEELNAAKADDLFAMRLLAESQAREKMLLDHFVELAKPDRRGSYQWFRDYAANVLAQTSDDTALRAALAAERERCAKVAASYRMIGSGTIACAIRALGEG